MLVRCDARVRACRAVGDDSSTSVFAGVGSSASDADTSVDVLTPRHVAIASAPLAVNVSLLTHGGVRDIAHRGVGGNATVQVRVDGVAAWTDVRTLPPSQYDDVTGVLTLSGVEGRHRVEVRGVGDDGVADSTPATVA